MKPNEEIEEGVEEYEHALDQTGFGRYNLLLLILGGGSISSAVIETIGLAYVIPAAQCDLNLSISDKSILSSISFIGIVLSCFLWGYLADSFGRRKMLLISISISCIFGFASSLVPFVSLFIFCRFFNGFFIGCAASVSIAFIGEFHSNKYRSKIISWTGSFVAASTLYLPGICWLFLPMSWKIPIPGLNVDMSPWRVIVILMSLPSFSMAIIYWIVPESPKFLWSMGKSEECLEILRNIFAINTRKDKSLFPIKSFELNKKITKIKKETNTQKKSMRLIIHKLLNNLKNQIVPLFTMPLLPSMLLTSFLQFGIQTGAQGVFMWIPDIFNKLEYYQMEHPNEPLQVCTAYEIAPIINGSLTAYKEALTDCTDTINEEVFIVTAIYGAVYTCVFTLIGFIVDIFGKKILLITILLVTSLGGALLNVVNNMDAIKVCIGMFQMLGPCMNLVISVQVDLFPTKHRGKAVSLSQMIGRLGAVTGSSIVGYLLKYYCYLVFYIYPSLFLVLILLSCLLPVPLFIKRQKKEDTTYF